MEWSWGETATFTRQELHELVWSQPISTLAERFGVTGRGLAKICERHRIPVPGRGYWAGIQAGQEARVIPLQNLAADQERQNVKIARSAHPSEIFAEHATERALARIREAAVSKPSQRVHLRNAKNGLHSTLIGFANELGRAPVDYLGGIKLRRFYIHHTFIPRLLTFLNTLAYELEAFDAEVDASSSYLHFRTQQTSIHAIIESPRKRVESKSDVRSFENVFVGQLALRLYGPAVRIKKIWKDKDDSAVEDFLADIVTSIRVGLLVQAEIDDQQADDERREKHKAHREALKASRLEREGHRADFLRSVSDNLHEIDRLEKSLSLLPRSEHSGRELLSMIDWAHERLSRLRDETTADAIELRLREARLFPDPDDLQDPGELPSP